LFAGRDKIQFSLKSVMNTTNTFGATAWRVTVNSYILAELRFISSNQLNAMNYQIVMNPNHPLCKFHDESKSQDLIFEEVMKTTMEAVLTQRRFTCNITMDKVNPIKCLFGSYMDMKQMSGSRINVQSEDDYNINVMHNQAMYTALLTAHTNEIAKLNSFGMHSNFEGYVIGDHENSNILHNVWLLMMLSLSRSFQK
jgi:hypothetical protein